MTWARRHLQLLVRRRLDYRLMMATAERNVLHGQLGTAWKLAGVHLLDLTTEECLWRPTRKGLHVHQSADGVWRADWPEHEGYDIGPPSIGWTTWHILFWWSMVLDHSFGAATLTRENVLWPGDASSVRASIGELHARWRQSIDALSDDELGSTSRTKWPIENRPFRDVVAWVNLELTKNAAEIGYGRFLYAVREASSSV
jgi:hypothetical protein